MIASAPTMAASSSSSWAFCVPAWLSSERLHGGDLGGELLELGLLRGQGGGQRLDLAVGLEDLVLELAHRRLVVGDLVLDRLVFLVLLDLVELDLQVVDPGLLALEQVLALLSWTLASCSALAGVLQRRLARGERRLPGGERLGPRGQAVAKGLGPLVELVEFAEIGGGRGHRWVTLSGRGRRTPGGTRTGSLPMFYDSRVRGARLAVAPDQKKTAGRPKATGGLRIGGQPVLSRKPSSCRLRTGCWSLRTALASIWRTRSRVTLKMRPTSSSV